MRSGLIAIKLGMMCVYSDAGVRTPVTVLKLDSCQVIAHRTLERDGYTALQLGSGNAKETRVSKPIRGHFSKCGVALKRRLFEFRVAVENLAEVGLEFKASHFVVGQLVDATSTSVGKGFSGVMKRWHFGGMCASHGVSVSHRSQGSTGHRQEPSKVFKGKKMAGHLGCEQVTVQNLRVMSTDVERGVILLRGSVPGPRGSWVLLRDAVKASLPADVPYPGSFHVLKAISADVN